MDHLPTVENPFFARPEIPYLSRNYSFLYDHEGWTEFPHRLGWALRIEDAHPMSDQLPRYQWEFDNRLDDSFGGPKTDEEIAAFLQSWLFIGLIAECFGIASCHVEEMFVQENADGVLVVHTSFLNDMAMRYNAHKGERYSPESWSHHTRWVRKCLSEARRVLKRLPLSNELTSQSPPNLSPELLLSIGLVIDALSFNFTWIAMERMADIDADGNPFLTELWRQNNWCPSDISWITKNFYLSVAYCASLFGPRAPQKNHRNCSPTECIAMHTDENHYETLHHIDCISCHEVGFDSTSITEILKTHKIPLISLKPDSDQSRPTFQMVPGDHETSYVAISHVWADGMGNPAKNSLPSCQLQWLHRLVAALPVSQLTTTFWIDTLCIPTSMENEEVIGEGRKLAISRIRTTFENATAVLVVDRGLLKRSVGVSAAETLMPVLLSNWQRRLWTLQEGFAAKLLYIQFSNRAIDVKTELHGWVSTMNSFQMVDACVARDTVASASIYDVNSQPLLRRVWTAVQSRTTSHTCDEIFCVAAMLDWSPDEMTKLIDAPKSARYRLLIDGLKEFPPDIIFQEGQRMREPSEYGWCPASFIQRDQNGRPISKNMILLQDVPFGKITPEGLEVRFWGIKFRLEMSNTNPTRLNVHDPATNHVYLLTILASEPEFTEMELRIHDSYQLAIIARQMPVQGLSEVPAVVVSVVKPRLTTEETLGLQEIECKIDVKIICRATVTLQSDMSDFWRNFSTGIWCDGENATPSNQLWCVT